MQDNRTNLPKMPQHSHGRMSLISRTWFFSLKKSKMRQSRYRLYAKMVTSEKRTGYGDCTIVISVRNSYFWRPILPEKHWVACSKTVIWSMTLSHPSDTKTRIRHVSRKWEWPQVAQMLGACVMIRWSFYGWIPLWLKGGKKESAIWKYEHPLEQFFIQLLHVNGQSLLIISLTLPWLKRPAKGLN